MNIRVVQQIFSVSFCLILFVLFCRNSPHAATTPYLEAKPGVVDAGHGAWTPFENSPSAQPMLALASVSTVSRHGTFSPGMMGDWPARRPPHRSLRLRDNT